MSSVPFSSLSTALNKHGGEERKKLVQLVKEEFRSKGEPDIVMKFLASKKIKEFRDLQRIPTEKQLKQLFKGDEYYFGKLKLVWQKARRV